MDLTEAAPLIKSLLRQIEGNEYKSLATFDTLKPLLTNTPPHIVEMMRFIENEIDRLDYKKAHTSLLNMAKALGIKE
ncbi:MAG: hypothetical protein HQL52_18630 [Magnetococcales bacterium]|nr:hypothetical protein [Magnetococcales bacterium]